MGEHVPGYQTPKGRGRPRQAAVWSLPHGRYATMPPDLTAAEARFLAAALTGYADIADQRAAAGAAATPSGSPADAGGEHG